MKIERSGASLPADNIWDHLWENLSLNSGDKWAIGKCQHLKKLSSDLYSDKGSKGECLDEEERHIQTSSSLMVLNPGSDTVISVFAFTQ